MKASTTTQNNGTITFFKRANHTEGGEVTSVVDFLEQVRDGKWQDGVLKIRTITDEEARKKAKEKMPNVTLSGFFNKRTDKGLVKHSGFIAIDIDKTDPEHVRELLKKDKYVYAVFTSISGRGACAVFRINGEKHREAFDALSEYLFDKYKLLSDPQCVNPSRARFVSYDPHLYLNLKSEKFTDFTKKPKEKRPVEVVYVQSDFDDMVKEIVARKIDLTPDYPSWLRIGFALADSLKEKGRAYFHALSQFNNDYDKDLCDKQFDKCLAAGKAGVTLASLYYYAKQAGVRTVSDRTKIITQAAQFAKKGGRTKESVIKLLWEAEQIPEAESSPIIDQVFEKDIPIQSEDSFMEQVQKWLKQEYELKRNEITRKVEVNGKEMDDIIFNDIFCMAKIVFESINAEILQRIINSNMVPTYNPFFEFFKKYENYNPSGIIKKFLACIQSDMGLSDDQFFPQYVEYFGTKWLVGIISSIHGKHSPLMLVLTGPQGNGKTEFFRQLLPDELQSYFAESKMDNEKDDIILMTRKLIIHDDEMSGRSKKEERRMKELTSKQKITVREPYGRYSSDLNRIAVFCGSTNSQEILNDPTGNRRIIPVHVIKIDFAAINAIDRVQLFMEAYRLYKAAFDWQITGDDIKLLERNTGHFEQPSVELELLTKYFEVVKDDSDDREIVQFLTPSEIKAHIEMKSMQKLNINKIGSEIQKMGAVKKPKKRNGTVVYGYRVIERLIVVDSGRHSVDIKKAA